MESTFAFFRVATMFHAVDGSSSHTAAKESQKKKQLLDFNRSPRLQPTFVLAPGEVCAFIKDMEHGRYLQCEAKAATQHPGEKDSQP